MVDLGRRVQQPISRPVPQVSRFRKLKGAQCSPALQGHKRQSWIVLDETIRSFCVEWPRQETLDNWPHKVMASKTSLLPFPEENCDERKVCRLDKMDALSWSTFLVTLPVKSGFVETLAPGGENPTQIRHDKIGTPRRGKIKSHKWCY